MKLISLFTLGLLPLLTGCLSAQERPLVPPVGSSVPLADVVAHDPVMIKEDDTYYVFTTGPGIAVWTSHDLETWKHEPPVLDPVPAWVAESIPNFQGHVWAPDISFHDGRYYLYYSVSAFGKNTSAIGLATTKTLDRSSPDFGWVDHGCVIQSYPGLTNWNAIDGNLIHDTDGTPYMAFGSFWGGLMLAELSPDRRQVIEDWRKLQVIASRARDNASSDNEAGPNAIEAPFIYQRGDYFYLFVSFDFCCRGLRSDYKVAVGRATDIRGPYVDRDGRLLTEGGGTVLIGPNADYAGIGHNGITELDGTAYFVVHGYERRSESGWPKLLIMPLEWDAEGWPSIKAEEVFQNSRSHGGF